MMQRLMCIGVALGALASGHVRAGDAAELDALKARVAALETELAALKAAQRPVELGQQMLELQIRHARLWYAGQRDNWTLATFQLGEMREALDGVVEANGDHAALQPERLAEVLPATMGPALKSLQSAVDKRDRSAFNAAYDQLTGACNACHEAASFGFNRFQRPRTPLLDNQQYGTSPDEP
jgi:hypothetical protein